MTGIEFVQGEASVHSQVTCQAAGATSHRNLTARTLRVPTVACRLVAACPFCLLIWQ